MNLTCDQCGYTFREDDMTETELDTYTCANCLKSDD